MIAHRGAHNGIPENSLPAYQEAIDLGCDFVEIDLRSTKDGKIVSIHNATVDAYVKGTTGKVNEMTLAALKALDLGDHFGPNWKNTRIPTLEEILQLCKGKIGIYLDLKEPIVPEILTLIRKYDMEQDIVWYVPASEMDLLKEIENNCPRCLPMPDLGDEKNISSVTAQIHPLVVASDMTEWSKSFVRTAHANGAMVFVDEAEGSITEWMDIIKSKTDGIQTDHPKALIDLLKQRD